MTAIEKLIQMDRETQLRIAVVGDALVDVYVHGVFGPCQEDCPKFVEFARVICPGGAMNAARQLEHWNASIMPCADNSTTRQMPTKTRYIVDGKYVFRHDSEVAGDEDFFASRRITSIDAIKNWQPHAILISDYDKGFMTPAFIREVIGIGREFGIPCVADAKREPGIYRGAIFKCNEPYYEKYRRDIISHRHVVTRGYLFPDYHQVMLPDVSCVNHVGAGDCFAAHLTLALAHGLQLRDAVKIAHSAGRVYVQYPHNRPPMPEEIRQDLESITR